MGKTTIKQGQTRITSGGATYNPGLGTFIGNNEITVFTHSSRWLKPQIIRPENSFFLIGDHKTPDGLVESMDTSSWLTLSFDGIGKDIIVNLSDNDMNMKAISQKLIHHILFFNHGNAPSSLYLRFPVKNDLEITTMYDVTNKSIAMLDSNPDFFILKSGMEIPPMGLFYLFFIITERSKPDDTFDQRIITVIHTP